VDVALRSLSLCSGIGGLDIGVDIGFGGPGAVSPVCYVEREITAAQILARRMEEGALPAAPIWSDLATFDGRRLRGVVDVVTAGLPCPDYSLAGNRRGRFGEHGQVWDHVLRAIREVGPRFIVLENVSGIRIPHRAGEEGLVLPAGLHFVLGDLAESGYDAEWLCLRASDVGAPHRRERWFCLAWLADAAEDHGRGGERGTEEGTRALVADADGRSVSEPRGRAGAGDWTGSSGEGVSDPCVSGPSVGERQEISASALAGTPSAFPPAPCERAEWERVLGEWPHLAPAIESGFRCVVDGTSVVVDESRRSQLCVLGNSVVPLQAAVAVRELLRRIGYWGRKE
jgi:site-specific DNA-cytosine methylase